MILDDIVARKRLEVARLPAVDPSRLSRTGRDFRAALAVGRPRVAVIAEVKKASPSGGTLAESFDPAAIAATYEECGAAAISVLTDVDFFQGALAHLAEVAATVARPVLRKDFIIDERQIYEARAAGADTILLIAAILDRGTIRRFLADARALGMEPLVEIHDREELDRAVEAGARVVGINNRNLRTFQVDPGTTLRLAPLLPAGTIVVSESGLEAEADLRRLAGIVDAALIGTSLMKSADRAGLLRRLVAATA